MPSAAMPTLPPGFRFHPTDEELIVHYLTRQAASMACPVPIIAEVNIYKCNPWDLPGKALFGENEWYFFSPRDRKYPNGARPNRSAGSGYWKATGTDKAIVYTPTSENIGVKKALVFYRGKPPKGAKTDWIMHEYRLTAGDRITKRRGSSMRLDDWVLCRIHKKCSNNMQQFSSSDQEQEDGSTVEDSQNNAINTAPSPKSEAFADDEQLQQLRPMAIAKSCSLTDLLNTFDYAALSQLLLDGNGASSSDVAGPADQPPPPESSPLIYAPPPWQTLNYYNNNNNNYYYYYYNNNYSIDMMMPQLDDRDYANDDNSYNGMKRKRSSLEDGGGDPANKSPLLPSDSRTGSSSSYCNQVQLADQTSGSSYQYSGMLIHPFLNQQQQQQLLLNNNMHM